MSPAERFGTRPHHLFRLDDQNQSCGKYRRLSYLEISKIIKIEQYLYMYPKYANYLS
jgi:hypothetical protein